MVDELEKRIKKNIEEAEAKLEIMRKSIAKAEKGGIDVTAQKSEMVKLEKRLTLLKSAYL